MVQMLSEMPVKLEKAVKESISREILRVAMMELDAISCMSDLQR